MVSGKYETIDRKFLDTFYRECGREVTLAYTVLNQTNTWAITFFAAVIGSSLVGLVKKDSPGSYSFDYPNPFHWLYLILAWGLLLRFIQRSALALSNMYRWNKLAASVWEVAALPERHPLQPELNDALVLLVDELMIRWRDPHPRGFVLWGTLKLMYIGPLVVLLGLIIWGILALPHDALYWWGIHILVAWTAMEVLFVVTWNKSPRQALQGADASKFLPRFLRNPISAQNLGPSGRVGQPGGTPG
jgi:hypothetical protein